MLKNNLKRELPIKKKKIRYQLTGNINSKLKVYKSIKTRI